MLQVNQQGATRHTHTRARVYSLPPTPFKGVLVFWPNVVGSVAVDVTVFGCRNTLGRSTGDAHWEVLLRARAIETQCYVAASAQAGTVEIPATYTHRHRQRRTDAPTQRLTHSWTHACAHSYRQARACECTRTHTHAHAAHLAVLVLLFAPLIFLFFCFFPSPRQAQRKEGQLRALNDR